MSSLSRAFASIWAFCFAPYELLLGTHILYQREMEGKSRRPQRKAKSDGAAALKKYIETPSPKKKAKKDVSSTPNKRKRMAEEEDSDYEEEEEQTKRRRISAAEEYLDSEQKPRFPWGNELDHRLRKLVKRHKHKGRINWVEVAKKLDDNGRSPRSAQRRWQKLQVYDKAGVSPPSRGQAWHGKER